LDIDRVTLSISKEVLGSLDGFGFRETTLGDPKGSLRQYRNGTGIHVREYRDRFVIHKDSIDPRENPIGHLVRDSPETLFALGVSSIISVRQMKKTNPDHKKSPKFPSCLGSPIGFLFLFLSLNSLFGWIKKLIS